MEQLLWTFDDVVRFVDHPDLPVRRWALERLNKRFPDQAGEPMVTLLDDPDSYIALMASEFLPKTGDGERYGPILLERLKQAQGARFGYLSEALARLDHREALPLILERLERARRERESLDANEFLRLVKALGKFGGNEARQALWEILDSLSKDRLWAGAAMQALMDTAQPEDVARLVQIYRSWPPSQYGSRELDAFASAVGATRLAQEVKRVVEDGFDAALERAAWWMGSEPVLSEECEDGLVAAFRRKHKDTFRVLLHETQRIIEQRGDDLVGWLAAWEAGDRPVGYRRRALLTMLILRAFAAHPHRHLNQRMQESSLGLSLLCQLSIDCNDQARLDASEDKTETMLNILTENRDNLLPGIIERVAALGPEIVPRLVDMLDPTDFGWGAIRIARAIERTARLHPGSCDAAIPVLIEAINDTQGDYLLEACSDALEAIGLAAVKPITERLRDDDTARQIYLTGVLGEIPTESAAQAILDWVADGLPLEEMQVSALSDIGSPSAIEPLYALWKSGHYMDRLLAEALLVLCELNGVQKPELPEWRRIVEAEESRLSRMSDGFTSLIRLKDPAAEKSLSAKSAPPTQRKGKRRRKRKRKRKRKS